MNSWNRLALLGAAWLLSACSFTSPYEAPAEKAPHALLKLKFKYSEVVPGTTLAARIGIRHGAKSDDDSFQSAFNQNYGSIQGKKGGPEIPMTALKVHPGKKTDVSMAVYFYWYTTQTHMVMINRIPQMQTHQVYHEKACTVQVSFTPEADKVYLLDYSSPNVDHDCSAHAYEQVQQKGRQFKLVKVGSSRGM